MTGASTGIGLSLAFECASHGYDLLIVADEPQIHEAARELQQTRVEVKALEADLATLEGVDRLLAAAKRQNGLSLEAVIEKLGI